MEYSNRTLFINIFLTLDPGYVNAYNALGIVRRDMGVKKWIKEKLIRSPSF